LLHFTFCRAIKSIISIIIVAIVCIESVPADAWGTFSISSSSHPDQNKWYAENTPSFTWTISPDDTPGLTKYSYQLDQGSSTIPDDTIEGTNTTYTYAPLADGIHYFHIKAMDAAGNWSNASHYKIQIDTKSPSDTFSISSSSHPEQSKWYATNTPPSFTWTTFYDDASGFAGYSYELDKNPETIPNDSIDGTNIAYTHNGTLTDGIYYFHVKAGDAAGNWSNASHYKIQVDTKPPDILVIFSSNYPDQNKWYATNTPPSLIWTTSGGDASGLVGYSYLIDKNSETIPDDSIEGTNTAYTHTVPLADGIHYFHIKVMDSAGNWGNASHYKIQIDTQFLVFPNPFNPGKGEKVKFQGLINNVSISIYNLAGDIAWEKHNVDLSTSILWDGRNKDNEPVASGTYIYIITDADGNKKKTGKVAVIW